MLAPMIRIHCVSQSAKPPSEHEPAPLGFVRWKLVAIDTDSPAVDVAEPDDAPQGGP